MKAVEGSPRAGWLIRARSERRAGQEALIPGARAERPEEPDLAA
jgi:undecaprenyl-diphosphatase